MNQPRLSIEQALELASQHAQQGNVAMARNLYSQILRLVPEHETATSALQRLPPDDKDMENTPDFGTAMRQLLGSYTQGDAQQTLQQAKHFAAVFPTQPMPLNICGAALLRLGRCDDATTAIKAAIDIAPGYADAWVNLGEVQVTMDDLEAAITSYQHALELDQSPGVIVSANRGLGKALANLGNFSAAQRAFGLALALQPGDVATRVALALATRELAGNEAAIKELLKAIEIGPDSALAHLELGRIMMRAQRYDEALNTLQKSLQLDADNPRVYQYMGQLYAKTDSRELSAQAYRHSLLLDPQSAEVRHLLDAVEDNHTTIAPPEYVVEMFDQYASTFDHSLVDVLGYQAPECLLEMILRVRGQFKSALDLGCGTGLMGQLLGSCVETIDGVDLSSKMLAKAQNKNIYRRLHHGDIVEVMRSANKAYELIVSTDVLIYLGLLEPFMEAVQRAAQTGSLLAFSTELLEDSGTDYKLRDSGRYAHSKDYVCSAAERSGLELIEFLKAPLRKEEGEWLQGGFYTFGVT